ncbi:MAG: gliding motility-associated C-terminal domain-containing protein [Prevotellaceae bacterium]|jgi:gliding motility-associated-like protein|nr:gliding motility-associated C-terminal domain-containing protein [Prevotellaceae bacterium]
MQKMLYMLLSSLMVVIIGAGQASAQSQPTTEGKAFWVSFAFNYQPDSYDSVYLELKFVASRASRVKITYTENMASETIDIPVGVTSYILNRQQKQASYNMYTGRSAKSIYVESDNHISVFAMNQRKHSADASIVLPVSTYGKSYRTIGYISESFENMCYIIASEDNTDIIVDTNPAITLAKGEVYLINHASILGKPIKGNKAFALFYHNSCTNVPTKIVACDCLFEQLIPIASWGTKYMVPVSIRGMERVKILASKDLTLVQIAPKPIFSIVEPATSSSQAIYLNAGEYSEIEINQNTFITSNAAISVSLYMVGYSYTGGVEEGDPAMAWIPSIDQNVSKVTIAPFIAEATAIKDHYVSIVAATSQTASVKYSVNGSVETPLSGGSWANHSAGYSVYNMPLNAVKTAAYTFTCPGGLTITGYGRGVRESYSYMAGASVRQLTSYFTVNGVHYQDADYNGSCGTRFELKAVIGDVLHPDTGHIKWLVDGTENISVRDQTVFNISGLPEGLHKIELVIRDDYGTTDTMRTHIEEICPPVIASHLSTPCGRTLEIFTAYPDKLSYRWFRDGIEVAGANEINYTTRIPGTFEVEITTESGVSVRSATGLSVSIRNPAATEPDIMAVYPDSICPGETLNVRLSSSSAVHPQFRMYGDPLLERFIRGGSDFWIDNMRSDTTFYVTVSGDNVCENLPGTAKKIEVKLKNRPSLLDSSDIEICSGDQFTYQLESLDAVMSVNWRRVAINGISNVASSGSGHIIERLENTTKESVVVNYSVDLTGTNGCASTYNIKVRVKPRAELLPSANIDLCSGSNFVYNPQSNMANTEFRWQRQPIYGVEGSSNGINGIDERLKSQESIPVRVQYDYILTVDGCVSNSQMYVNLLPAAHIDSIIKPKFVCAGEMFSIEIENSSTDVDYVIYDAGGSILKTQIGEAGRTHIDVGIVNMETIFKLKARNSYGCASHEESILNVLPAKVNITTEHLPEYIKGRPYSFQLESDSHPVTYSLIDSLPYGLHLSPSGMISGTALVSASPGKTRTRIEIQDANGCAAYKEFILESIMFVPQIFSPNGDGVNDVFMKGYRVAIYDRLGVLIFEGSEGWNGEYKGKAVSRDTYFYILRYTDDNQIEHKISGDITIIR